MNRVTEPWFASRAPILQKASPTKARKLAADLVRTSGPNPETWLRPNRFQVKEERGLSGALEALCIPMTNDRFRFVIFTKPDDHPDRKTFLVCHEAAHTLFYRRAPGERPKRAVGLSSDWEEDFCDAFAHAVTGKTYSDVGLKRAAT